MPNPLVLKLENLVRLSSPERDVLERLTRDAVHVGPGQDLVREGDALPSVLIVLQGCACRYKLLPDARRQITAYLIPGDSPACTSRSRIAWIVRSAPCRPAWWRASRTGRCRR